MTTILQGPTVVTLSQEAFLPRSPSFDKRIPEENAEEKRKENGRKSTLYLLKMGTPVRRAHADTKVCPHNAPVPNLTPQSCTTRASSFVCSHSLILLESQKISWGVLVFWFSFTGAQHHNSAEPWTYMGTLCLPTLVTRPNTSTSFVFVFCVPSRRQFSQKISWVFLVFWFSFTGAQHTTTSRKPGRVWERCVCQPL